MNIGIFLENYQAGGMDRVLIDIIVYWPNNDDKFILICNEDHEGLGIIKSELGGRIKCTITYKSKKNWHVLSKNFLRKFYRGYFNVIGSYLHMPMEIVDYFKIFKPLDFNAIIIHNGGWPAAKKTRSAALAAKIAKINKIVYVIHSFPQPVRYLTFFQERLLSYIINKICILRTVSYECANALINSARLKSIKVIYNGIRDVTYNNKITRSELDIGLNNYVLITVGTLNERRGHLMLLEIFAELVEKVPESVLLIVGTGLDSEINLIKERIKYLRLTNQVKILGFRNDVPSLMYLSDVVVNPVQMYESFGLVAVEAMAMKRVVVSSSVGGVLEVVSDGTSGFLFNPNDQQGFLDCFIKLRSSPNLRRQMGVAGFNRYKKLFLAKKMSHCYWQLLKN